MKDKIFQRLKQVYAHLGLANDILEAHSEGLAQLGFVTDENLEDVVAKQKGYLESLQRANDKRVTDARAKAKKDAEDAARKAKEEADKKAADDAAKLAAEEAAKKAQELPDSVKAIIQSMRDDLAKREADAAEARKASDAAWQKKMDEMTGIITGLRKENDDAKRAEAARQRTAMIEAKAKSLGIPEFRIKEGFNIAEDADEAAVGNYLSTVAENIKANLVPAKGGFPMSSGEADPKEVGEIAKSLVDNL